MKKVLILLISILALIGITLFSFKSCEVNLTLPEKPSEKIELVVWIQESFAGSDTYFNELISKFEKFNPEVTITYEIIKGTDYGTYKYITNHLINGNSPDLLLLSVSNYNTFATEYTLMDLNPYEDIYSSLIPSTYRHAAYNGQLYGIAYFLDPEILVYNIHHLSSNIQIPNGFSSNEGFLDYVVELNTIYKENDLDYHSFSVPSLISNSEFVRSLQLVDSEGNMNFTLFRRLQELYKEQNLSPYYYNKDIYHPFFTNATTISLEPLSLVYGQIDSNYAMNESIGILPLKEDGLVFSHSQSHYISIYKETRQPDLALAFMAFFLTDTEIRNRYKYYNVPIISQSLKDEFIQDSSYSNGHIWNYLEQAYHFPLDPNASLINATIDDTYNQNISGTRVYSEESRP